MTQNQRIMRHLQDHGSITQLEAMHEYGIMRLASRVSDLRRGGVDIRKAMIHGTNRYGEKTAFAKYYIEKEHN